MDQNMSRKLHSGVENVIDYFPSEEVDKISDPLYCRVCNIRVTSLKMFPMHNEGRKHKARAARKTIPLTCDLCNITANSEIQLNIHLNSPKHLNKLLKKEFEGSAVIGPDSKGLWILMICVFCIFINFLLLFKVLEL